MNSNEILNKYINLIDKGYCCDCNELNCIDNFPQAKITHAIRKLQQENKQLKEKLDKYENPEDMTLFAMWCTEKVKDENKQLKYLIDTILNFPFFKEECPLNFGFENNSKEDKAQNIFYNDEYCENNCNGNYKDCWLKYFKELQELEQGSDSNGNN